MLGTVVAWNLFVLLGYLGAGGLTFLWLRSIGLGVGASLAGGLVFALAPYRAVQGAGHLLAWIGTCSRLALGVGSGTHWLTGRACVDSAVGPGASCARCAAVRLRLCACAGRRPALGGGALAPGLAAGVLVWGILDPRLDRLPRARSPRLSVTRPSWRTSCRDPRPGSRRSSSSAGSCRSWRSSGSFCIAARASVSSSVPGAASDGARARGQSSGLRGALGDGSGLGVTRVPGRLMVITCPRARGTCRARAGVGDATEAWACCSEQRSSSWRSTSAPGSRPTGRPRPTPGIAPTRRWDTRKEGACSRCPSTRLTARRRASTSPTRCRRRASARPGLLDGRAERRPEYLRELQPCADVRNLAELGVRYLAVYGRPRCGSPGACSPVTGQSRSTRPSYP